MKLLCLGKDPNILEQISIESTVQKWLVKFIHERTDVVTAVRDFEPDLLLVEVSSIDDLQWWQDQGLSDQKPLLFINAEMTEDYLIRAFECGADGLIPKPYFSRRLLVARVNCYLRRQGLADSRRFVARLGMVLDSQRYKVEVQGSELVLTLTEYKILRALSTEQEVIVNRRQIQNLVFGDTQISKRSLDVHICALRKKLRPFNLDISSVRGVGYGLNACAN